MPAFAEHPYLINEIAFFQNSIIFASLQKYYTHKWNDMKVLILLAGLISVASQQCSKRTTGNGLPQCVQQKIDVIKQQPRWNPPAQVDEYELSLIHI